MVKRIAVIGVFVLAATWAETPQERWQYCRVTSADQGYAKDGKVQATAQVCVMTEDGCRTEDVTVSVAASSRDGERRLQEFAVAETARAKALAQLGNQGWEMSAVIPRSDYPASVFYLRRRLP